MMQPYALSALHDTLSALHAYKRRWQALLFPTESTSFSISVMMLLTVAVALGNAVVIVQVVNLYHRIAAEAPLNTAVAMRHGWTLFSLEQRLHLAVEPAVQRYLSHEVRTPLGAIPAALIRRAVAWVYLHALPSWLFAALAWSYVYKARHFPLLRDVTIVSILLAVVCQRLFPAAPPRFVLQRAPYNLLDWTYSRTSLDPRLMHMVGFNPYAAFPSVHVLWALIPALCLAVGARHPLWWAIAAGYPLAMMVIVISSGNHYVFDCIGSVALLAASWALVSALHALWRRVVPSRCREDRRELPAALALCVCCAGTLAVVAPKGGVRVWIALEVVVLVIYAAGRSPYLWHSRRRLSGGRQVVRPSDYLAGLLFVAGAAGAAAEPGQHATFAVRVCVVLWLLAAMAALYRHITARRSLLQRGYDGRDILQQLASAGRRCG